MKEIAYLNGAFLPLNEAKIPVTDYGFLFGYGLYETCRVYQGRLFRLDDHLARLEKSARALNIPCQISRLKEAALETVRLNPFENARLRLTLTPGPGSPAADIRSCSSPTTLVTVVEYKPFPAETYKKGFRVIVFNLRRNSQSLLAGMKSISFIESMLARQEARIREVDDALLLNDRGSLAEASSSNVFLVSGGVLITPAEGSGLLPGITRQVVIELAQAAGLKCREKDIQPPEMQKAEEVFITNSMIEIMPVTVIEGRAVGSGVPGPVTRQLMEAYRDLVKAGLK
ncbi:MAG TPA: aminotransferase class IV [Dehalococcoidales bacterium]|nr:aminotransferase class IV [Dehalococcoidales bacterium]